MAPSEQWQEVNIAATKRYIGCLKRLSGKVHACVTETVNTPSTSCKPVSWCPTTSASND
jgi:hypothetical protein